VRSPATIYRRIYEGVNFRLRTLAGGYYAAACRPVSIVLLLTERCNARCIHCDIWKNKGKEESPEVAEWKSLLLEIREWLGPVQVVFSGGEALLKPYAMELVEHAASLGLFVELLSHGNWEDQSKFVRLASAKLGRFTFSLDGVGETHSLIRGRDKFFEKTERSIQTLIGLRESQKLEFGIRLKTVVMNQNLDDVCRVAEYAKQNGVEVFFQPIEQNYNTLENPNWFQTSPTWPEDTVKAVAVVDELIRHKTNGAPIANSIRQLEAMRSYFRDPAHLRVATQAHSAHEKKLICSALTMLQIQANGDVTTCTFREAIGNIKSASIRSIWENRPQWWKKGCCLETRNTESKVPCD
jgi:MoaA/NifB/PqqE/SkfB family radical SAM enzyme